MFYTVFIMLADLWFQWHVHITAYVVNKYKYNNNNNNNNNNKQLSYLYKTMEINQTLSINRIMKQYQITVHFYLILNKQYAYVVA